MSLNFSMVDYLYYSITIFLLKLNSVFSIIVYDVGDIHVEVRGQMYEVPSLLLPLYGFPRSNLDFQAYVADTY